MTFYIYQDKDLFWKIHSGGKFPFGVHEGRFNSKEEAEKSLKDCPEKFGQGIPLCSALKNWRKDHGIEEN